MSGGATVGGDFGGTFRESGSVLSLAPALLVLGCVCPALAPHEAFAQADAVFAGRVLSEHCGEEYCYRFEVTRVWKGDVAVRTTVRTDVACGPRFDDGVEYVVSAVHSARLDFEWDGVCSLVNRPRVEAPEVVRELGEGHEPPLISRWQVFFTGVPAALSMMMLLGFAAARRKPGDVSE